jgi:hypothetical protein
VLDEGEVDLDVDGIDEAPRAKLGDEGKSLWALMLKVSTRILSRCSGRR